VRLHADWDRYLHRLRTREIDTIFGDVPPATFRRGLELGAGDGFQSALLRRYVGELVCTDYTDNWFAGRSGDGIRFQQLDAERIADAFGPGEFDLIFSSNMFEHLPDAERALRGIHHVLADDGITIHVMPSPFWKLSNAALYFPQKASRLVELMTGGGLRDALERQRAVPARAWDNNPKTSRSRPRSIFARLLLPPPHGVSKTHIEELRVFSRARWLARLEACGFEVIATIRGPVSSGYGFGLDRCRAMLEGLGLTSEHVYVAVKKGRRSPASRYFLSRPGATPLAAV